MATQATTDFQPVTGPSAADILEGAAGTGSYVPTTEDLDQDALEAAKRDAQAAERDIEAQIMALENAQSSTQFLEDERGDIGNQIADLRATKGGIYAAMLSGNVSVIHAAASDGRARAAQVKIRLAEENREAMMAAAVATGLALSSGDVLARSSLWQTNILNKLMASGDYISTHEEFGFSETESIFNQSIEDIDARIAAASGAEKEALLVQRQQLIDLQVKTNEQHTVEALENWSRQNPELAQRAADRNYPASIEQELSGLDEGPNKQALRIIQASELVELQEKVAKGEKISPEQLQKLQEGQEWLNGLSEEEKREIKASAQSLASERKKVQARDTELIAEQVAELNRKTEEEISRIRGGQGHEQTQYAQAQDQQQGLSPLADIVARFFGAPETQQQTTHVPAQQQQEFSGVSPETNNLIKSLAAAFTGMSGGQEHFRGDPPQGNNVARAEGIVKETGAFLS